MSTLTSMTTTWRTFLLPLGSIVHSTVEENFILVVVLLLHVGHSIVVSVMILLIVFIFFFIFFLPGVIG